MIPNSSRCLLPDRVDLSSNMSLLFRFRNVCECTASHSITRFFVPNQLCRKHALVHSSEVKINTNKSLNLNSISWFPTDSFHSLTLQVSVYLTISEMMFEVKYKMKAETGSPTALQLLYLVFGGNVFSGSCYFQKVKSTRMFMSIE